MAEPPRKSKERQSGPKPRRPLSEELAEEIGGTTEENHQPPIHEDSTHADGEEPGTWLPALGPKGIGWVALQGVGLFWVLLSPRWSEDWDDVSSAVAQLGGLFLAAAGGAIFARSFKTLGKSLTPMPVPMEKAKLITEGPYAYARHPIYGGLMLACFGWAFICTSWFGVWGAVTTTLILVLKSVREEALLVAKYREYPAYRKRTRRFIPVPQSTAGKRT